MDLTPKAPAPALGGYPRTITFGTAKRAPKKTAKSGGLKLSRKSSVRGKRT